LIYPKNKKISQPAFKKSVWKIFSEYIRLKECIETTGTPDFGICCSCGQTVEYKNLQAGHFISGRTNSVLFDECLVHIQCVQCNIYKHGNYIEYEFYMINRYGKKQVEQFKILKNIKKSLKVFELIAIEQYYKKQLLKLKQNIF